MFDLTGAIIYGFIVVAILGPTIINKIRRKGKAKELKELVQNTLAKYKLVLIQHECIPLYVGEVNRIQRLDDIKSKIQEAEDDFIALFSNRLITKEGMLHKKLRHLFLLINVILGYAERTLEDKDCVTWDIKTYRKLVKPTYKEFTALTKLLFNFKYYQQ